MQNASGCHKRHHRPTQYHRHNRHAFRKRLRERRATHLLALRLLLLQLLLEARLHLALPLLLPRDLLLPLALLRLELLLQHDALLLQTTLQLRLLRTHALRLGLQKCNSIRKVNATTTGLLGRRAHVASVHGQVDKDAHSVESRKTIT
jgi:hypothetical protein